MLTPVSYIVRTTMSNEIVLVPTSMCARFAESMARLAATALRSMQGICTRPQMGSHVRPRWCSMAISAAYSICSMGNSISSHIAAAAMEQAEPISA